MGNMCENKNFKLIKSVEQFDHNIKVYDKLIIDNCRKNWNFFFQKLKNYLILINDLKILEKHKI
jgi:hypothetical protein